MLDTLARPFLKRASSPSTDFDFLMGIWRCHHRYRVRRLDGCNDWIEFDGTCTFPSSRPRPEGPRGETFVRR